MTTELSDKRLPVAESTGLRLSSAKTLQLFVCCWIFSWAVGLVVIGLVGGATLERLRWAVVLQDLVIFMLPTVMTFLIAANRPWRLMGVDRAPGWFGVISTLFTLVVAIPAMNLIVAWNESVHLPDSMARLEELLRTYEATAGAMVEGLLGGTGVGDLLVSVLIIGILTGVAEECFFRGGLQSILMRIFPNPHVAIWVAAVVFSAIHMQFFGFVPRLLLGAFFGYLYWWSGSLWLAVAAHAFNNSLVVLNMWLIRRGVENLNLDSLGAGGGGGHAILAVLSFALAFVSVWYMWRHLPMMRDNGKQ